MNQTPTSRLFEFFAAIFKRTRMAGTDVKRYILRRRISMRLIENESGEIRQLEEAIIGIKIISAGAGKKGCARETNGPARWKNAFARRKMEMQDGKMHLQVRKMEMQVGKMHLQEEKWRCKMEKCICR
jgi:hypothetical protein